MRANVTYASVARRRAIREGLFSTGCTCVSSMQELGIYGQFKGDNRVLGSGLLAPSGTRLRGSERHKSRLERNILYAVYGSGNRKNFVYSKASS
jgi:hypothetical protein